MLTMKNGPAVMNDEQKLFQFGLRAILREGGKPSSGVEMLVAAMRRSGIVPQNWAVMLWLLAS